MQTSALESKIMKLSAEVDKLYTETAGIENEIRALQEKIMEVGGVKLRSQKAKVDGLREQIIALNDRITTCDVARVKNEKDCEKFTKLMKSSEEELETLTEELAQLEEDMTHSSLKAEQVRKKAQDAEHILSIKQDELNELRENLDERRAALQTTRGEEIEMRNRLEEHQKVLADNQKRSKHWSEKLKNLSLSEMSSMLGDEHQELVDYSEDELAEMDKEALKAEIAIVEGMTTVTKLT
jgi:structural maintenance of chromosome 4